MDTDRVSPYRADEVRRRLCDARKSLGWSLGEAVKAIEEAASLAVYRSEVRRYEGGDPKRKPVPTLEYVSAFAKASGQDEGYMLAEDVLPFDVRRAVEDFRSLEEALRERIPQAATSDEEKKAERRRDAVFNTLALAVGLPVPTKYRRGWLTGDVLAEIHEDLQLLFWEAFDSRGFSDDELVERAYEFGSQIPSPHHLHRKGFVDTPHVGEIELRRWWRLQSEALRILLLPNETFSPHNQRLAVGAKDGFPTNFRNVMATPVGTLPRDKIIAIGKNILDGGFVSDEAEAARAKRVREDARTRKEIGRMKSPEDRKRAKEDAYRKRTKEKRERWARERNQIPEDADTSAAEPLDETEEPQEED